MTVDAQSKRQLIFASATDLRAFVNSGEVSAREIVDAHIARMEEVDGVLNAVPVRRFAEARHEADAIDAARARRDELPALAGVPITVKECFYLAGTPSTMGIGQYAGAIAREDGELVARLRKAGAIVLGKTNVPQGMLMNETDNPVYGRTNNPWNLERGPGGSSGGEAAMIAAGGSVLGLGNDVGGSIRQPAHCCGICGLKPTSGRLTNIGSFENLRGLEAIVVQPGPLARSVADIRLAYSILEAPGLGQVDWQIPPVPAALPAEVRIEDLRIGYWTDDGYFPSSAAIQRGVLEAAEALRAAGAQVEPFAPPDIERAMSLYFGLLSADGGADLKAHLGRSPRDWRLRRLERLGGLPRGLQVAVGRLIPLFGQRQLGALFRNIGHRSGRDIWKMTFARREFVRLFMDSLRRARIDCLLTPVHPLPALTHGSTTWLNTAGSHCMLVNLLGCPAGVAPVTRVRSDEENCRHKSYDIALATARNVDRGSEGLPVGVQVIAPHWREYLVLAVMQALENRLKDKPDYPARPPL